MTGGSPGCALDVGVAVGLGVVVVAASPWAWSWAAAPWARGRGAASGPSRQPGRRRPRARPATPGRDRSRPRRWPSASPPGCPGPPPAPDRPRPSRPQPPVDPRRPRRGWPDRLSGRSRARVAVLFHPASVPTEPSRRTRDPSRSLRRPGQPRSRPARLLPRWPPSPTGSTSIARPVTLKILLENVLRHAGGGIVEAADVETLASWRAGVAAEAEIPFMPARVILQDFTGVPAIVDLAVMRDAMADLGGDPARVNPLVPADLVIDHSVQVDQFGTAGCVRLQRRARVRAQRRALPAAALGPDRVPRPARRAAGHRHRPPGQPRVPGQRRDRRSRWDGIRPDRLSRHARRDRLAHDDDQRPRRPRLRRRRDRGRGRPARPAALPADAPDRRRPPPRRAAARLDRDRPRPRRDPDAARARRRRRVRRVRRRRPGRSRPRRPGHDQQHEPGVRGDRHDLPDRRRDARLPAPDRPAGRAARPRRALREGAGPVARARRRPRLRRAPRARPGDRRPVGRRPAPAAGPGAARPPCATTSGRTSPTGSSPSTTPPSRPSTPVGGEVEAASAESFPASDPPSFTADGRPGRGAAGGRRGGVRTGGRRPPLPTDHDRGRRPAGDDPDGLGRDRRDHVVHEHLEPDGHGRGRAAGPERRRARADASVRPSRPRSRPARRP